MDEHRKPPVSFWFAIAVGLGVVTSIPVFFLSSFGVFDPPDVIAGSFDPAAWRRADPIGGYRTVRSKMIDDLLHKYDFRGWTRAEVENLLGPPEPREGKEYGFPQFDRIYLLGLERGGPFSLDDEALGFVFDDENKVSRFGISVN